MSEQTTPPKPGTEPGTEPGAPEPGAPESTAPVVALPPAPSVPPAAPSAPASAPSVPGPVPESPAFVPGPPPGPPPGLPLSGPAAPELLAVAPPAPPVRRDRRALRAVVRWTAAVLVCGSLGAATAYGITGQERTDVPGLATAADGRWVYPTVRLPPLPDGAPHPFDDVNTAESHAADLRALVLPAPKGAKADPALAGKDGWLPTTTYLAQYEHDGRQDLADGLVTEGLRHIAARGWTMPDGTRTRIFLLQFSTGAAAEQLYTDQLSGYEAPKTSLADADGAKTDAHFPSDVHGKVNGTSLYVYDENGWGAHHDRQAYIVAGDTIALVVESRDSSKGSAPRVPFEQTVVLQNQLLG